MTKKRLGRGLDALITIDENENDSIKEMKINDIEPNTAQPRKKFDDESLNELAESIKKHGVIQPIIIKKQNDMYKIVAGERRWRAARIAGLDSIPVIVKDLSEKEIVEVALIENLQREDLNPIEEAEAYEQLISEYEMTQEEISQIVGKSRSAIANTIRLLGLCDEIKRNIIDGKITSGHARALLTIENKEVQKKLMEEIIKMNYNVRDTEKLVKKYENYKETETKNINNLKSEIRNQEIIELEEVLKNILGTKVKLNDEKKKGKIIIEYYSNDELDRIVELIRKIEKQ
ncbi:MAG TPA: ParB/RepB/Spo0J family partition protein [Clostridiales bacterium]|nr:ParB/RepB/Spo0J family partition protein [Clostridiales bacterium]